MDSRMRLTFACGTCLGLAIGFSAGHFSLWNRVQRSAHIPHFDAPTMGSGGFDLPAVTPPASEFPPVTPSPGGAVVLNDPDLSDEPVHAEAIAEVPALPKSVPSPLKVGPAKPLTPVSETAQINSVQQAQQSESADFEPLHPDVVKMLADELRGATEQQREVWSDALRGMTPEDAAGIILMWKKFGQAGPGELHSSGAPPLFSSSHPDQAPLSEPASLKEILTPADVEPASPIAQWEKHNLDNARTCGYLNLIPIQQELSPEGGGPHQETVGYRLDLLAIRRVPTGNPAHVTIEDGGFLAVQLSTGEVQYTRIGRLALDSERRLCVDLGDRDLPLTPEVKLPEGAYQLIKVNGQLRALVSSQSEPVEVIGLQVARFFDASRLKPVGGGLYSSTTASGAAQFVPASVGLGYLDFPESSSSSR